MAHIVTASIDAQNTFSDSIKLSTGFDVSISGTFAATVVIQRSYDDLSWKDVESFTAPIECSGYQPQSAFYRIGVKTGGYTSGTVVVSLSGTSGVDYTT